MNSKFIKGNDYPKESQGRICITQPYIFPYLGFFHLLEATDFIVFYDDVNYIKRGWINRNRIILNKQDFLFSIPVKNASQNKLIYEIEPLIDEKFKSKFYNQIRQAYSKAHFFDETYSIIKSVLDRPYKNITDLIAESISAVYNYLELGFRYTKSSAVAPETKGSDKSERLICITKKLGFENYINLIGGQKLYTKEEFANAGVNLHFVHSQLPVYKQFTDEFIPYLSIIDILMHNSKADVIKMFKCFSLK